MVPAAAAVVPAAAVVVTAAAVVVQQILGVDTLHGLDAVHMVVSEAFNPFETKAVTPEESSEALPAKIAVT